MRDDLMDIKGEIDEGSMSGSGYGNLGIFENTLVSNEDYIELYMFRRFLQNGN